VKALYKVKKGEEKCFDKFGINKYEECISVVV
jgi:hypothetical protein